jgi:hypothetical protein
MNLLERIGIDRSVLCDFIVLGVDTEKLKNNIQNEGEKSYSKIVYDDKSPVELENGKKVGKLVIKNSRIGKLTVSFEKNNLSGKQYVNSSLELMVSADNNNIQNLNTAEYQTRIIDVFNELEERYGVIVDYSTIMIKKLELNATFFLNEAYEKYRQAILLLIRSVPPKRYGKNQSNNSVKYATWHEANMQSGEDKLETALVKNSSIELKIYNKGKHLKDIWKIDELDRDIMRVEYTIKDKRILENAFGDNLVTSLTDEKINELFRKYFNRDIAAPYYQWASKNHKQLVELTKKHREQYQKWTSTFFRECRQYAAIHGLPILFDLNDMRKVFKELEPKSGRNSTKKFNKFKNQAIYETDLIGNTARVKEIISKIEAMYQ